MAKKNPFIENAASAEEVAKLEGKKTDTPIHSSQTKSEEVISSESVVQKTNMPRKKKQHLDAPVDDRKWKREKNPLYDMELLVNPIYLENGEFTSTQMCETYGRSLKKFAYDKNTSIRDLINIAIFEYGLKEGFLKRAKEE
jgi:hypothetical protein